GRDAAVVYGTKDLCFKNNTGSLMLIRATVEDKQLTIGLYGKALPGRSVEIVSKDYQEIPYAIIENEDASLQDGQVVVDQKAKPGFSVTTVRLIRENGKLLSREEISHDLVQPVNKIMRIPLRENISSSPPPAHRPFEGPDEGVKEQMQPEAGVISVPDIDAKESLAK
ncbi:MAG TPA: G5 domain-containing protein, partial [Armatimonadota bacterium]